MGSPDVIALPAALTSGLGGSSGWPSGPSSGAGATEDEHNTAAGSNSAAGHAAPDELAPGTAVGRYMILSRLGAGAMGVVYAAYDPELDRKVALKLLQPRGGSSLDSRIRLMREAKALARLSHPNVVAVHDVGTFAERVFLAMEFVDGKTLGAWLKERPQRWPDVLAIMRKAGEGLAAAHAAGLVHRDFKPDNVLIARDGRVRVLDFGLARSAGEVLPEERDPAAAAILASVSSERRGQSQMEAAMMTRTGAVVGTPAYMSPEQHLGRSADARSDQFSFCVAMYQALYGARPFVGERMSSLAFPVLQGKIAPAPGGSAVPMWLRKVVLRGLQVDPDKRYPGMPALLADLNRDDGRGRRRGWFVASSAIATLGLGLGLRASAPAVEAPCQGARDRLAGIWDEPTIADVERAFRSSGLPYAAETWTGVRASLDAHAAAWTGMHTDSCAATRIRGEQSDT
ncbi:MAG TPA: serine/threonine-protein kinase, partial [Nannocystis sp.]